MKGWIPALAVLVSACGPLDPCDEYVDYMCSCHPEEVDCNALALTYEGADPDVQDECAVLLNDQEEVDQGSCGTGA